MKAADPRTNPRMQTSSPRRAAIDVEAILTAALGLFAERGYQATTMDDIGGALGIRGPSLYKHVRSKQDLLAEIMLETMRTLIRDQEAAVSAEGDVVTRLRRAVEAHVRYHAAHRREAFVGNREIGSLEEGNRHLVLGLRDNYERRLRAIIEEGCAGGQFSVPSARLASYAILDMGIGVAAWFRAGGEHSVDRVAYTYAEHAIRIVTQRP
jgi:AcrR family transcriptional regulator